MTIVHLGGARKTYMARIVGTHILLEIPMSEQRRFRLSDGRATTRRLEMWRVDPDDLELCRKARKGRRRT